MNAERIGHTGPIGMTLSAVRPASPIDSSIKPINVLSEPHENSRASTESGSPSASAATRLQQTLDKSDTRAFSSDVNPDSLELDQLELRNNNNSGSSSSIRIATTAARGMVAGLFTRRKKSTNSLNDSRTSMLSKSPTSGSSILSTDSEEEYLYNVSPRSPSCSPRLRNNRDKIIIGSRTLQHNQSESLLNSHKNFPTYRSSTIKKATPSVTRGDLQTTSIETFVNQRQHQYSSFTLTQNRFDNRVYKRCGLTGQKSPTPTSRENIQDIFMNNINTNSPSKWTRRNSKTKGHFRSPAGALIRQSSVCRSVSSINEGPIATPCREGSIHSSGTAALTSVLTSPNFDRRNKITSLSPPSNYRLPESDGYVSFPPYVPSYNRSSLANIFGRNESVSSLALDVRDVESEVGDPMPNLRRTLGHLVHRKRNNSIVTQISTVSDVK